VPGDGPTVGGALVGNAHVDGVAFTGGTDTARRINRMLAERNGAIPPLIAETGGLNAMIADSTALPEQLVRDAVMSAFDSAGQRCSALRVLFLQSDIADKVLKLLSGAVAELKIGDPMKLDTDIGPVIDGEALAMLEAHAARMARDGRVIVEAKLSDETGDGYYFAPRAFEIDGIARLEREVFGPILHVVRYQASHLDKVLEAINLTGYGLTLGVHTRIQETADFIRARARVGNLYVNRNQIGAVVGVDTRRLEVRMLGVDDAHQPAQAGLLKVGQFVGGHRRGVAGDHAFVLQRVGVLQDVKSRRHCVQGRHVGMLEMHCAGQCLRKQFRRQRALVFQRRQHRHAGGRSAASTFELCRLQRCGCCESRCRRRVHCTLPASSKIGM
jgi:hypothetical protein